MSQLLTYNNINDGTVGRRYSGFPLNSTLVSSYTLDTIRSIISHAAAGQPYSTAVWIRINRSGIQVSAQDAQIARTRIPVFIPIGLVHDIFMLPNINNVICIVYDELQSNMKGVLLYVVHPTDAQFLREDFRNYKQSSNNQQVPQAPYSSPFDNRAQPSNDVYQSTNNRIYTPVSSNKSPLSNEVYRSTGTVRQQSPRRVAYGRDRELSSNANTIPTLPQLNYTPAKGSYHDGKEYSETRRQKSPKRGPTSHSPTKRSIDSGAKRERKHRSRSPEKQIKTKVAASSSNHEISREKAQQPPPESQQQQQQQEQQLLQQQQQQWLIQQQQMAAWQAAQAQQQAPLIPIGIYNRYVPKTIPLPTGETLKTTLPTDGTNGAVLNGTGMAFIEPQQPVTAVAQSQAPVRSHSNSPQQQIQQPQNRSLSVKNTTTSTAATQSLHHHHQYRRQPTDDNIDVGSRADITTQNNGLHTSRPRTKNASLNDDETKLYLRMLVDEMQAMKVEMNKLRQATVTPAVKTRSDSLQIDLKEIRSHIDLIRARMAMTPRIPEH